MIHTSDETEDDDDDDFAYEDQENGSSVDIETEEVDDDDCGLCETTFQRLPIANRWLMTADDGAAAQEDMWHYNERAYEDLCYVTFSSEVIIVKLRTRAKKTNARCSMFGAVSL